MIKKPVFFTKRNALILQGEIIAKTGYRTMLISQEILHKIEKYLKDFFPRVL
jgi:hypothetical protein